MAPIVASTEIARSPDDVFAYVTDPSHLPEWQESVVKAERVSTPDELGTRVAITRQVGPRKMTMTSEITEVEPPRRWTVRGVDGPVRGSVTGRVEPLDDGARSRVTIDLDLHGHGIGKLLVPLFVERMARHELPRNVQHLKERLEHPSGEA